MHCRRFPVSCAALLLIVGCSSAPTHFYTMLHPAEPAVDAAQAAPVFAIEVMPVGIPAQANQPQLVVRTGAGSVALLDNERWAAPLADEIRAALADDLTRMLGVRDVYKEARSEGQAVYRIQFDVRRFESLPAKHALIEADWSLRRGDGAVVAACQSRVSEVVGAGYDVLVEGHQRALAVMAAQIAATLRSAGSGNTASCPQ